MPYAIIQKERIIDVVENYVEDSVELSKKDMLIINECRHGHAAFKLIDGNLIEDYKEPENNFAYKKNELDPIYNFNSDPYEAGSFGGINVMKIYFKEIGMTYKGHKHCHDHISLLMSGSVSIKIPDYSDKIFKAPTYITIREGYTHEITSLEDNTLWWCLWPSGEDEDEKFEKENSPYN